MPVTVDIAALQAGRQIVDQTGRPQNDFLRALNDSFRNLKDALVTLSLTLDDIVELNNLVTLAQAAATAAQASATAASNAAAGTSSYVTGLTLTATDAGTNATITISAHTRKYPQSNGTETSIAVNGGSLTAQPYSTNIWIGYDDASRAGGAVTYFASTTPIVQVGARHSVGVVTTPAAAAPPNNGKGIQAPGYVEP